MNRFFLMILSAALATLFAFGSGQAQDAPPGGPDGERTARPGGGVMVGLLRAEKVQAELALSDQQKHKLLSLGRAIKGDNSSELSANERRARVGTALTVVDLVLTPTQLERLKEIWIQVEGPAAIADPEIAKSLDITTKQSDKLAAIRNRLQQKMGDAGSREDRQKMLQIRKEAEKEMLDVLTPSQRDQFQTMKGRKLDLKPSDFPPPER